MQIIAELEHNPRRIYTGAIGFYAPNRQAQFNVAIRTLRVDRSQGQAEYGVGGGIVWDSQVEEEWEETISKRRVLVELPRPFDLFETMRWSPDEGWYLLEQHLQRLEHSAAYFDFLWDRAALLVELERLAVGFGSSHGQRVRLTLSKSGEITFQTQPLLSVVAGFGNPGVFTSESSGLAYSIALAKTPVRTSDRFLYHKTTRREIYQRLLAEVPGVQDVLLFNERGEVTESTIANLVYELDGVRYTPPVGCGLLPGTQRAELVERGLVQERPLRLEELQDCSQLWLVNSLRGIWDVELKSG
jgi:para-aminobenzoate synthetase / 4-amino-4-deoxychorismate lyase